MTPLSLDFTYWAIVRIEEHMDRAISADYRLDYFCGSSCDPNHSHPAFILVGACGGSEEKEEEEAKDK